MVDIKGDGVSSEEVFHHAHHKPYKGGQLSCVQQQSAAIAARKLLYGHNRLIGKALAKDTLAKAAKRLREDIVEIETKTLGTWAAFLEAVKAYESYE